MDTIQTVLQDDEVGIKHELFIKVDNFTVNDDVIRMSLTEDELMGIYTHIWTVLHEANG